MVDTKEILNDDVLSTPELTAPTEAADAHRGQIVGVTSKKFDTGSTGIELSLKSSDAGFDATYMFFPPTEFVDNIHVDPTTLSEVPNPGKKQSPQQRYAVVIANANKTAEIQALRIIAQEQGRTLSGAVPPTSFEDYVSLLNSLLSGVEVVFTRKPDESAEDPRYRGKLKVNRIYPPETANKPKALKAYKKSWL
jgi:hypothetical protein